jgi:hypothetical protein
VQRQTIGEDETPRLIPEVFLRLAHPAIFPSLPENSNQTQNDWFTVSMGKAFIALRTLVSPNDEGRRSRE